MKKWDYRFMDIAEEVAKWSKDPSTKVGAVIVKDRRIISYGFNGFSRYTSESPEDYEDRAKKYEQIIHAETNAILFAQTNCEGMTIYTTHPPCSKCALLIIQSGITNVVSLDGGEDYKSRWKSEVDISLKLFSDAGVEFSILD